MSTQTIEEFMTLLQGLGVRLSPEGDNLLCSAPKGAIQPELRTELANRKGELLEFLRLRVKTPHSIENGRAPDRAELALSSEQHGHWVLSQTESESAPGNVCAALELDGLLDPQILESSLLEIVRRHEVLRCRIVNVNGTPKAAPSPCLDWKLQRVDLRGHKNASREEWARGAAREECQSRFNLGVAPLFRAKLLEFGDSGHVLLLTCPRIAADEQSVRIIVEELGQVYSAFQNRSTSPLRELPLQFADFAASQSRRFESEEIRTHLDYGRGQSPEPPPVIELPTDRPRRNRTTRSGARRQRTLGKDLADSIRHVGRMEQCNTLTVLLSALNLFLSRYTRQEDLIVGSAVSARNTPELNDLVGPLTRNVGLRTNLGGDPTVRQLIRQVRDVNAQAIARQADPIDKLLAASGPAAKLNFPPAFQVMLTMQSPPLPPFSLEGLSVRPLQVDYEIPPFDLAVEASEKEDSSIDLFFKYSTDLFDDTTIDRMARHFENLLSALVGNLDSPISKLRMIGVDESRELLAAGAQTFADYPREVCVDELFERQVAAAPNRVAVVCNAQEVTYSELSRRSNQLAHILRRLGVGPEALVGICLDRSIDMVVAMLAVLKSGGAYVPMDPYFPSERLAFMARDAAIRVLLTDERSRGVVHAPGAAVFSLDGDRDATAQESEYAPPRVAAAHNLAYVIFTSGSTGLPKGVQITHRSVVNFLESMRKEPGLSADDSLLSVTTLSFDIAALEIFLPLVVGARVVLAPRSVTTDGRALSHLLSESNASVMQATPATWRLLLESGWEGRRNFRIFCGGEALSRELADQLVPKCLALWNLYGPTETTIWSLLHKVTAGENAVPIGKPIANTQVCLLDDHDRPVPFGVPGELYLGGDGLARGYLNRPELTAERFVPHPFLKGERLYRTGDLARFAPNGTLQFLGRLDQQVKIRGFRVELGEIETAIERCEGVSAAAVVLRNDLPDDQRLVAYVIPADAAQLSLDSLRSELHKSLPDYMMPSAFVVQKEFPLTPNRKIDRRALPPPDPDNLLAAPFVSASTEAQKDITAIWTGLLNRNGFGIHDNFFDLGGHSLLFTQLQGRLRHRFGREIPMADLFKRPTIAAIAELLDSHASDGGGPGAAAKIAVPGPVRTEQEDTAGRSFIQSQLLAIWQHVLELHGIGIHDNFYELGGDSRLATKLYTHLEKIYGHLPASLLLEAPTVQQMAEKLASAGIQSEWRSLVAIQPIGDMQPFFLIPGGIGNPLTSTNFVSSLPRTRPVYGLQYVGLDGRQPPLERVEDIAAHFVSEVLSVQKKGPYRLGGHCLGGVIAFEMAQQLAGRGHEVSTLVLIDTFPPSVYQPQQFESIAGIGKVPTVVVDAARRLRRLSRLSSTEKLAHVRRKIGAVARRGSRREMTLELQPGDVSNRMWEANIRAIKRYRPKAYKGAIVLIVSDGEGIPDTDPRLQWIALSGLHSEIHKLNVPNHDCLIDKPWVGVLAEDLRKTLERGAGTPRRVEARRVPATR